MTEEFVESCIKMHLKNKGWRITTDQKKKSQHGVDIKASHPIWRKRLLIEAKGGSSKHKHQEMHNAFYNLLGQCLSRMDIEGNSQNKGRIYAFGIPYAWEKVFKNKIKMMRYGWGLLKLKGFLVKENGDVLEKTYGFFLK